MELMDESLTHFLETATRSIPYHIQVNFCHDIALALTFLHANGIVHRDLSSNNVLLINNVMAKVTDFGMAKLGDLNPRMSHLTFTMCPGTDVYMPPEAVQDKPVYTEKIDCFSFGVVVIQMLTRQFPKPDDRMQRVEMNHPGLPRGTLMVCIPEVDRRQNHISQIDPNNTLLPIALDCLKDRDVERPSAKQLCERVAALKATDAYSESVRAVQTTITQRDMQEQLVSLRDEHAREILQLQESQTRELQSLREEHREIQNFQEIQSKEIIAAKEHETLELLRLHDAAIRAKEMEIQQLKRELKQNFQIIAAKEHEILDLLSSHDRAIGAKEGEIQQLREQAMHKKEPTEETLEGQLKQMQLNSPEPTEETSLETHYIVQLKQMQPPEDLAAQLLTKSDSHKHTDVTDMKLTWRKGKPAPQTMYRVCNAVVDESIIYFNGDGNDNIQCYNRDSDLWTQMPQCPNTYCSFVIVNHTLTAIGGLNACEKYSNDVYSLKKRLGAWVAIFPPMPTKRASATAICTESSLIVVGGVGRGRFQCPVEIMSIEDHQWSIAAGINIQYFRGTSGVICGDQLYILGAFDSKSVYSCTLGDLLESCQSASTPTPRESSHSNTWRKLTDLPAYNSTCVSFCGHLVAIGGNVSQPRYAPRSTKNLYIYNRTTNSWEVISEMSVARRQCFVAALPATNELMVVGGTSGILDPIDSVEFASLI
jgi:hypothetical protein